MSLKGIMDLLFISDHLSLMPLSQSPACVTTLCEYPGPFNYIHSYWHFGPKSIP